jgi:anti-sigma B factor antagonist
MLPFHSHPPGPGSEPEPLFGIAARLLLEGMHLIDTQEIPAAPVIVTMPSEIDLSNADSIGEQLLAAIAPGMSAIVADLTGTAFCDCSGARSLLLAYRKAAASNTQLLLAVPSSAVLPILELLGLRRILRTYPTSAAALAAVAETAAPTTGRVPPPIEELPGVAGLGAPGSGTRSARQSYALRGCSRALLAGLKAAPASCSQVAAGDDRRLLMVVRGHAMRLLVCQCQRWRRPHRFGTWRPVTLSAAIGSRS